MSTNITGYIPEKVTFISKGYTKITNTFEDGGEINSFEAMPTFIEKTNLKPHALAVGYRFAKTLRFCKR